MTARKQVILDILDEKGSVQLSDLEKVFPDVSVMTLRRDLISLEGQGQLIRTHGGAVKVGTVLSASGEESAYASREHEQKYAKRTIANKALEFIETGRSIYFDAGSTIMNLCNVLPDNNYSIITSGINIGENLLKKERPSVIVLGGFSNRNTFSVSGPLAISALDTLNIDIAFMSASGFSFDSNFTVSNIYEAELKRAAISKAKKVVMLMDSSKINKVLPYTFAKLSDIDALVTDNDLPKELKAEIVKAGVAVF